MASQSLPLPTEQQCQALTDEQCHAILDFQDPRKIRANPEWENSHQAELVRHYMRMLSFKQMEDIMRPRLCWTYKTYQNRFKDWKFPLDRLEREKVVRELFNKLRSQEDYMEVDSPHTFQSSSQIRSIQPQPTPGTPETPPLRVPIDFFQSGHAQQDFHPPPRPDSSLSVSTVGTLGSRSTQSSFHSYNGSFASNRSSVATTSSSLSNGSFYGMQFRPPKHDPVAGLWNNVLRVIPGCTDHTMLSWKVPFNPCLKCGFSRWHSLMVHAQNVGKDNFVAAMMILRGTPHVDFAGNYPIHYLMSAGVGVEFLSTLTQWTESCPRNVFEQNPLHVLNPLGLGDQLISYLEWVKNLKGHPRLLNQRDIHCHTPLQALLLWPLERRLYSKLLDLFPLAEQQIRAFDNTGRTIIRRMNKASLRTRDKSDYTKIQDGITEIKMWLNADGRTPPRPGSHQYGFHDIARGGLGLAYIGYYECKICNMINNHSPSYWDQMCCAVVNGRDRYEPDETGTTPAQAIVTLSRCNVDMSGTPIPETPSETNKLFLALIPSNDPNLHLHEALHVLDPGGYSLIYNIAIRGMDELLEYIIYLEEPSRRRSAVNFCGRGPNGRDWSVLDAVHTKAQEAIEDIEKIRGSKNAAKKQQLIEHRARLIACKVLLCKAGAESRPDPTTRYRIHFEERVAGDEVLPFAHEG